MHDELVAEIARRAQLIRLGNGLDRERARSGRWCPPRTGPRSRTSWRPRRPRARTLVTGGSPAGGARTSRRATSTSPTMFTGVRRDMRVIREETFGPILTVETFRTEEEAIELGNDTEYGLAGAVWSPDMAKAHRVASGALRHGTVWINDYHPYVPAAEWGGMKRSGNGRELGPTGPGRIPGTQAHLAQHRPRAVAVVLRRGWVMSTTENRDSEELAEFGYTQSLDRSIGKFASFAAGISYISILTGTFQLFYFGFAFGGAVLLVVVADGVRGPAHGGPLLRRARRALPRRRFGLQLVQAAGRAMPRRGWPAG